MSSLRNAVQRRNHKERAQPHSRQKWGILEKHKDYALRAQDHNVKKRKIKDLRAKAAMRNEDEFYFGMLSTQSIKGQKVGDRGNRGMDQKEVTNLKRQDVAYLRSMLQVVRKEITKLEEEVQFLGTGDERGSIATLRDDGNSAGESGHTVFVDDEHDQRTFNAHQWFQTDENGLQRAFNRPKHMTQLVDEESEARRSRNLSRKKQSDTDDEARRAKREEKARTHAREVRRRRIELLRTQERDLVEAEQQLELQRAKMSGTAASGTNKKGESFKIRERKR